MNHSRSHSEPIVVTLEQRQIFFILMGLLVLFGGILSLGYGLGRHSEGEPGQGRSAVTSELSDEANDVGSLTFEARLAAPSVALGELPHTVPDLPAPKAKKSNVVEKPQPKKEPTQRTKRSPAQPPKKAVPPRTGPSVEARAGSAARDAASVLAKLRKENRRKASGRTDTLARRDTGRRFTIQVSAFQNEPDAQAMLTRLRKQGHNPYLVASTVPGRGRWYRVRVGKFSAREAAVTYQNRFEKQEGVKTFITPM